MFELIDNVPSNAVIKVIGVGGGGCNAVGGAIAIERDSNPQISCSDAGARRNQCGDESSLIQLFYCWLYQ